MIGYETVRYDTIEELRRGLDLIEKRGGNRVDLNSIASRIANKHAVWLRSPGLNVVLEKYEDTLLIYLGWGDDVKTWLAPMKAAVIAHAKQNGATKLQVCSPRKGWARLFGIRPQGEVYEELI
jgi:hypothetical protein